MIVVHIDITDDGHTLEECYKDRKDADTILVNPDRNTVYRTLVDKPGETLLCLGHGTPYGLFGHRESYVIDSNMVKAIGDRDMIGIWCYANIFGKNNGLKGFFTHMFVSNPAEAHYMGFKSVDVNVTQAQNIIFAKKVNNLIRDNVPLSEWISCLQDYDKTLDFVRFNYSNLEYIA